MHLRKCILVRDKGVKKIKRDNIDACISIVK